MSDNPGRTVNVDVKKILSEFVPDLFVNPRQNPADTSAADLVSGFGHEGRDFHTRQLSDSSVISDDHDAIPVAVVPQLRPIVINEPRKAAIWVRTDGTL